MSDIDKFYMNKAITLSKKGMGKVSSNPMVGCLVVKNGIILSSGYHKIYGGPHAEVEALSKLKPNECKGAILYVTLEPCNHHGKTPPCTRLIAKYPFKKIVIGAYDVNPLVAGKGVRYLKRKGFEVICPIDEEKVVNLNESYVKFITKKTPFVTLKAAISLDGKIATSTGHSKWITNKSSRKDAHRLRYCHDAVMIGIGTVIADDPMLDCRLYKKDRSPVRLVIDPNGRLPLTSKIVKTAQKIRTIVILNKSVPTNKKNLFKENHLELIEIKNEKNIFNLKKLIKTIGEKGISSILIEGGGKVLGTALEQRVVDKLYLYIAPKVIGENGISVFSTNGIEKVSDSFKFEISNHKRVGNDIKLTAYFKET